MGSILHARGRQARPFVALAIAIAALAIGGTPAAIVGPKPASLRPVGDARDLDLDSVTAIYQDQRGFIWIGTREGLVMYDGYTAVRFEHETTDAQSLADNVVRTIYEDRNGNLWLGTNSGGLDRFDRSTATFEHHRHDSSDSTSLSHDSVNTVLHDREGTLWVGTQIGLNRMVAESDRFERIAIGSLPGELANPYVYYLYEDHLGRLWVATVGGGVFRKDPGSNTFVAYRHGREHPGAAALDKVFAIVQDRSGELWLGTEGGLSRIDVEGGRLEPVAAPADGPLALPTPLITSIVEAPDGTHWLGTWGGGVRRFDPRAFQFVEPPDSIAPDGNEARIVAMFVDRAGSVWAGTWNGGLYRAAAAPDGFAGVGSSSGLAEPDSTAILEAGDGGLWVGTWGGGLFHRGPDGATFEGPLVDPINGSALKTVLSLHEDHVRRLWIGTMDGLFRLDPATGGLQAFRHDAGDPDGIGLGYVTALLEDRSRTMWVGVGGSGLYRYVGPGPQFESYRNRPGDPNSLSEDYVTALLEGRDGTLWVGTRSGGLNAFDRKTESFERYLPDADASDALSHHYVTQVAEGLDGTLWVATAGGGLNRGTRDQDGRMRFRRYAERDGLIDNNVRAMTLGPEGDLWLGAAQGFSRFDPETERFLSWSAAGGLPSNRFNTGAGARGRSVSYLGSSRGILIIRHGTPFTVPEPSPTILRSIRTLDRPLSAEQPPWSLDRLEVPYGEMLTFEFAVLDYGDTRRHRFAYRLDQERKTWIDLGDRRSITFTDLDPGTYDLEIRGRDADGVWSAGASSLRLVIVPPFWMTTWFRIVTSLALVGLIVATHRFRTSALERRNRELLRLKEEREHALEEVRASEEKLHDAYERLRRLTRRFELAKEDERKRIARELHDEMGQALTAAKINVQLLGQDPTRDNVPARIADTVGLIDRMIRHVRALSLDLRPPLLDELGLGVALRGYLEAQAQRSGLDVRVDADSIPPGVPPEVEITTFRTVQEAVTNILRHANAKQIDVRIRRTDGSLDVSIRDDGSGFDVERTLETALGGHHLGLLGMRERVEGLGGSVSIRSEIGVGTEVRVSVPMNP